MREVNKTRKIFEGFFGEEVPKEIAEGRRAKCEVCIYNSKNSNSLNLLETLRDAVTKSFCTLCGCQIHEKTGSPLEECAKGKIGEEKEWFKIKIETMGKDKLNMIQVSKPEYDISLEEGDFIINFGEKTNSDTAQIEVLFEVSSSHKIKYISTDITCGCTKASGSNIMDNRIKVTMGIDPTRVSEGMSNKTVTLNYLLDGKPTSQRIKLKIFKS